MAEPRLNSIETGFKAAFATILTANLTTLIAAVVLFGVGSGPVRGFAITHRHWHSDNHVFTAYHGDPLHRCLVGSAGQGPRRFRSKGGVDHMSNLSLHS